MSSKIALGTAQFGLCYGLANTTQVSFSETQHILKIAKDAGVTTLDTAMAYGESETVLGRIGVNNFSLITKLSALPEGCTDLQKWVFQAFSASLARLKQDQLDGILLHRPLDLLSSNGEALYSALTSLKTAGLVKNIGISIYAPHEAEALLAHYDFDIIQAPLNLLDQRIITSGLADMLVRKKIVLHTRSAFLQGLLLMDAESRPQKFASFSSIFDIFDRWLHEMSLTPLEAAWRYACMHPQVSKRIIGVNTSAQLIDILAQKNAPLEALPRWPPLPESLINPSLWNTL